MKRKLLLSLALTLGLASNTWAQLTPNGDGVYEIGTAQDLADFATLVNGGTFTVDAVLTADIDMSTLASWTAIGNWGSTSNGSACYKGHFDGQGHKITGFNGTASHNYYGIFGVISSCLIENFSVYGTISTSVATTGGVAGYARDANTTIRNVHSYVVINNTANGKRVGGVLGTSHNGTIFVDRCTYSGTLDGKDSGGSGNYGGIVGYVYNNKNAKLQVTNCLFNGELKNTAGTPGNCTFGGIIGYVGDQITDMDIKSCLSIGTVTSAVTGQFYGAVKSAKATIVNSYYKGDNVNGSSSTVTLTATKLSADDARFASGELCYLLNESVSGGTGWYQTLPADTQPTPDSTHGQVYQTGTKCPDNGTLHSDFGYTNTAGSVTEAHDYVNLICSYCGDLNVSKGGDGFYEIDTPEKLKAFAAYVNAGNTTANAKLTDDIDLNGITWTPIGNSSVKYAGTFDGQGNAITNFSYTAPAQYAGLFGYITTATIKNFSISGTLSSAYNYTGMIGCANAAKVSGIHSSLNVTASAHTWVGGVVAGANGAIEIENCSFDGTLSTTGGNAVAGIMGYANTGTIRNCHFDGTLTGSGTVDHLGGILGYVANSGFGGVENCLSTGVITTSSGGTITNGAYLIGNVNTNTNLTNINDNYFLQGDENIPGFAGALASNAEAPHAVTASQLASGEICYALNGDQSTINWYQTKGTDDNPTLNSTHGQIYANGTVCPDNATVHEDVSYSNTPGNTEAHNFVDGFCSYCGTLDASYITPNGEGYYEIGNKNQLKWFATLVNAGTYNANAKLTADINLSGIEWTPIGIGSGSTAPVATAFTGTFDGQGHSITNFNAEGAGHIGLFGDANGATIKNFSISGSLTVTGGYFGGTVACPASSTIENVHSALVISVPNSGIHHVGGVVGSARGDNTISGCSFSGSLTVGTGSTDNFAGVVAYLTANDVVENCANYGSVTFSETECGAGGVVGYLNDASVSINNCLNIGTVLFSGEGLPKFGGAIVGRLRTHTAANVANHYWLAGSGYGAAKNNSGTIILTTAVEADATLLGSGEVAYKLGAAFYQTIGTDANPTLNTSHGQVILNGTYQNTASTLSLNDANSFGTNSNFDVTSVTMSRTLKADKWNTFCVPFDMDSSEITSKFGEGTEVKELDDVTASGENYTMKFKTASSIEAGKPYMVKVPSQVTSFSLSDKTIKGGLTPTTVGNLTFTGVFLNGSAPTGSFIISDNKFYNVDSEVTLKAFRGYITVAGAGVKAVNFEFDDDDATGIVSPLGETEEGAAIYNLAGQRINKMQKGINIVNGKKVMK